MTFPDGVLVINKPTGPTSHDIVTIARRALNVSRIGHTGTLDPMAAGVLPLVIGKATRLAQYFTGGQKEYEAAIAFGRTTNTYDAVGTVTSTSSERPTPAALAAALEHFRGSFEQTPPAFSAKNIDGERAYEIARKAKSGDAPQQLKPVTVHVERLVLVSFDGDIARLSMRVTAGFYVRSLAHDLGQRLGMGAVLTELTRSKSGEFGFDSAVSLEALLKTPKEELARHVIPFDRLLPDLPSLVLLHGVPERVKNGLEVGPNDVSDRLPTLPPLVRLMGPDGRLVALAKPGKTPGFLHASAVFG